MKNFKLHSPKIWLSIAAVLAFSACSSEDPLVDENTNPNVNESFSFSNYTLGAGMSRSGVPGPNVPPTPTPGTETSSYDFENGVRGVKITRTTYHQSGTAYNEFMIFNPAQTSIYPGHVFVGGSVTSGEYKPVKGQKLNPVVISNTLVPREPGSLSSRPLNDPTWSSYQDVLKDWLSFGAQDAGAMTEYEYHQVTT